MKFIKFWVFIIQNPNHLWWLGGSQNMKIIITENQSKLLTENVINLYEYAEIFAKVLNKIMRGKYDWFKGIEISFLSIDTKLKYMGIKAKISVDKDWGYNAWKEYNYEKYFYGNEYWKTGDEEYIVSFGDLIDSSLGIEIRDLIADNFKLITGLSVSKLSWFWIFVEFVD